MITVETFESLSKSIHEKSDTNLIERFAGIERSVHHSMALTLSRVHVVFLDNLGIAYQANLERLTNPLLSQPKTSLSGKSDRASVL